MTVARAAAAGALALAVALAVWLLLFKGDGGTEYTLLFKSAGQLVKDDDVQVGGRRVGSVRDIELTEDNQAAIKVTVQEPYAPLREGTQAVIRLTSLSGIANRYIALTPGARRRQGAARRRDARATESTTDVVDLDQIFNTLDEKTSRRPRRRSSRASPRSTTARAQQVGLSAKYFNPLLSTSRGLAQQLTEDEGALTRFLVNSSRAVTDDRRAARRPRPARRQHERHRRGDRRRERRARPRARPAADDAAARRTRRS